MSDQSLCVPAIAIDGVAGAGKGTAALGVANALGFNLLDSGALYRLVALQCLLSGVSHADKGAIISTAEAIDAQVESGRFFLKGCDVTSEIRSPCVDELVPKTSAIPEVRRVVGRLQLWMRRPDGLVADGRDMGIVFENSCRVYLDAPPEIRALRRAEQVRQRGLEANLEQIFAAIVARDRQDMTRSHAPLEIHPEAHIIDTAECSPASVVDKIIGHYRDEKASGKWR